MKNKKATYFLFVLVVAIWGFIAYKIVVHIKGEPEVDSVMITMPIDSPGLLEEMVKPELKLDYKDPFLKYQPNLVRVNSQSDISTKRKNLSLRQRVPVLNKPVNRTEIKWPEIYFSGIILNDKTNEEVALINIGGSAYLMRENETKLEVTLLNVYTDSIIVTYKEDTRSILKKN